MWTFDPISSVRSELTLHAHLPRDASRSADAAFLSQNFIDRTLISTDNNSMYCVLLLFILLVLSSHSIDVNPKPQNSVYM